MSMTIHSFKVTPDGKYLSVYVEHSDQLVVSVKLFNHDNKLNAYVITPPSGSQSYQATLDIESMGLQSTMIFAEVTTTNGDSEVVWTMACSNLHDIYLAIVDKTLALFGSLDPLRSRTNEALQRKELATMHSLIYSHVQAMYLERFNDAVQFYNMLINDYQSRLR